jgi:hypothetical protein
MAAAATVLYVQIPAYRDSELAPTLRSLYRNATHRRRMRVEFSGNAAAAKRFPTT